jgi:MFS family permease
MSKSAGPPHERDRRATLAVGLFSNGVWDMLTVVVPLYALAVGLNAAEIGMVVAARSVLPTALSIHGGIVMDQLGVRRVLLWVAGATAALPLLYPVSGWFTILVGLQLLLGLASNLAMGASQTWSLQTSRGDTAELARYSVVTRIGTFLGPVLIGAVWDLTGAWAAFACVALWGAGTVAFAACGTPGDPGGERGAGGATPARSAMAALVPNWQQHRQAIGLAAIPAIAFVLAVSFLRNTPGAVQGSLYVVYLADTGFSGTLIGGLVALAELAGVLGSLFAAPMERAVRADRLVLACVVVSIVAIAITPLLAHALVLLVGAAVARGMAQGMSQPLMYSILGRSVPPNMHGAGVGLRHAVTRFASMLIPAGMGVAAEAWGIEASFYVVGALFVLVAAALALVTRGALVSAAPPAPERRRRLRGTSDE